MHLDKKITSTLDCDFEEEPFFFISFFVFPFPILLQSRPILSRFSAQRVAEPDVIGCDVVTCILRVALGNEWVSELVSWSLSHQ